MSIVTLMDKNTNRPRGVKDSTEKSSIGTARRDMANFRASRTARVPGASDARTIGVWKPSKPCGARVSGSPRQQQIRQPGDSPTEGANQKPPTRSGNPASEHIPLDRSRQSPSSRKCQPESRKHDVDRAIFSSGDANRQVHAQDCGKETQERTHATDQNPPDCTRWAAPRFLVHRKWETV